MTCRVDEERGRPVLATTKAVSLNRTIECPEGPIREVYLRSSNVPVVRWFASRRGERRSTFVGALVLLLETHSDHTRRTG